MLTVVDKLQHTDGEPGDFDLTTPQKARLLRLAMEVPDSVSEGTDQRSDLLYDFLKCPLPQEESLANFIPAPVKGFLETTGSFRGAPMADLLADPTTQVSIIERIKEYAKQSGMSVKSEGQTDVLLSVYYAAIAHALLFHDKKLSEHSYGHLISAFQALAEKEWVSLVLRQLFSKAHEHCRAIEQEGEKVSLQ
ncbi:MAG: hypothetical protein P8Z79_09860 [Sedimentisphaerales bacterium]